MIRKTAWMAIDERLGFVAMTEGERGAELLVIRAEKRTRGIDVLPRVAMRRPFRKAH